MIILYRPETNEIIKVITGPFTNQHDVDILSDDEISIFKMHYLLEYNSEHFLPLF